VVIDGSADHSNDSVSLYLSRLDLEVIDRPNGGRAATRNYGAEAAAEGLLIFLDDDTRPQPDCISKHVHHHHQYPGSILVGAVPEDYAQMRTDFQRYRAFLSRKWTAPLDRITGPLPKDMLFLTAANFSVDKTMFCELSGFDEQLTDAEDYDLALRASIRNISIYYRSEALAWHDDFITCRSYIKRLRQYQLAHGKLHQLRPDLDQNFNQYTYHRVGGLKKMGYSLLAAPWMVNLIDGGGLRLLPRKFRYKLYDIVTTGSAVHFPDRAL
jgi:glycosyltransferase involved in cell wall biosynthesis